jgi:hypothetical protein
VSAVCAGKPANARFAHADTPANLQSQRVNARLKDEFGGRNVRVRSHAKVLCHLMFRHSGADLRSTHLTDHLIAIRCRRSH